MSCFTNFCFKISNPYIFHFKQMKQQVRCTKANAWPQAKVRSFFLFYLKMLYIRHPVDLTRSCRIESLCVPYLSSSYSWVARVVLLTQIKSHWCCFLAHPDRRVPGILIEDFRACNFQWCKYVHNARTFHSYKCTHTSLIWTHAYSHFWTHAQKSYPYEYF